MELVQRDNWSKLSRLCAELGMLSSAPLAGQWYGLRTQTPESGVRV